MNFVETYAFDEDLIALLRDRSLVHYTDFPLYTEEHDSFFQRWFCDINRVTILCREVSVLCGFASAHLVPKHRTASLTVIVAEAYQRQGYAVALMQYLLKKLHDEGYVRAEAQICTENIPSVKLFETLGFQMEGVLRKNFMIDNVLCDSYMYAKIGF